VTYSLTLEVQPGSHAYWFRGTDGKGQWVASGPQGLVVPSLDSPPTLQSPSVTTVDADRGTYLFEVTYRDPDGDAAASVRLVLDGSMYEVYGSGDVAAGITYAITLDVLEGTHEYWFSATLSDGTTVRSVVGSLSVPSKEPAPEVPLLEYLLVILLITTLISVWAARLLGRGRDGEVVVGTPESPDSESLSESGGRGKPPPPKE
jgi:hypothetical protein